MQVCNVCTLGIFWTKNFEMNFWDTMTFSQYIQSMYAYMVCTTRKWKQYIGNAAEMTRFEKIPRVHYLCALGICETITNLPESNGYWQSVPLPARNTINCYRGISVLQFPIIVLHHIKSHKKRIYINTMHILNINHCKSIPTTSYAGIIHQVIRVKIRNLLSACFTHKLPRIGYYTLSL